MKIIFNKKIGKFSKSSKLHFSEGKINVVFAQNGSGKSLLTRLIINMISNTAIYDRKTKKNMPNKSLEIETKNTKWVNKNTKDKYKNVERGEPYWAWQRFDEVKDVSKIFDSNSFYAFIDDWIPEMLDSLLIDNIIKRQDLKIFVERYTKIKYSSSFDNVFINDKFIHKKPLSINFSPEKLGEILNEIKYIEKLVFHKELKNLIYFKNNEWSIYKKKDNDILISIAISYINKDRKFSEELSKLLNIKKYKDIINISRQDLSKIREKIGRLYATVFKVMNKLELKDEYKNIFLKAKKWKNRNNFKLGTRVKNIIKNKSNYKNYTKIFNDIIHKDLNIYIDVQKDENFGELRFSKDLKEIEYSLKETRFSKAEKMLISWAVVYTSIYHFFSKEKPNKFLFIDDFHEVADKFKMQKLLRDIQDLTATKKLTTIHFTHDIEVIRYYFSNNIESDAFVLNDGKIINIDIDTLRNKETEILSFFEKIRDKKIINYKEFLFTLRYIQHHFWNVIPFFVDLNGVPKDSRQMKSYSDAFFHKWKIDKNKAFVVMKWWQDTLRIIFARNKKLELLKLLEKAPIDFLNEKTTKSSNQLVESFWSALQLRKKIERKLRCSNKRMYIDKIRSPQYSVLSSAADLINIMSHPESYNSILYFDHSLFDKNKSRINWIINKLNKQE